MLAAGTEGKTTMPRLTLATITAIAGFVAGCAHVPPAAPPSVVPNLFDAQQAITQYIDSGRYQADVAAVVTEARAWLEQRAPSVQKPAIVLDIDETALSNWRAYRVNGWARITHGGCDLDHGPCNLRLWQNLGQSEALPATRQLVDRARQLGVAVFFVTGRSASGRAATERNLREQGYAFDRVILRPEGTFPSAVAFKAPARCAIEREGYRVLLSMGDQQSDLDGGCAERTFKLPNPVYFLP